MLKQYAGQYYRVAESLMEVQAILKAGVRATEGDAVMADSIAYWLRLATNGCKTLGLQVSMRQIYRIVRHLAEVSAGNKALDTIEIARQVEELSNRIKDELTSRHFIYVTPDRVELYDSPRAFGEDVETQLPETAFDIAEAARCLALRRPTACIFHLMRVLEIVVQKLGAEFGVPLTLPDLRLKTWGEILTELSDKVKALTSPVDKEKKKRGSQLYARLDAVRIGWRNDTMHPNEKYTDEEAEEIFGLVRGFCKSYVT